MHNKTTKQIQIIEVGITSDIGITATNLRKVNKYTDFRNILKREWRLDDVVLIPVIMGVTGIYHKKLNNLVDSIWGEVDMEKVQGEVVKSSVNILKRALSMEV